MIGKMQKEVERKCLGMRFTLQSHTPGDLLPPTTLHLLIVYSAINLLMTSFIVLSKILTNELMGYIFHSKHIIVAGS
jgi:hypothetical protein